MSAVRVTTAAASAVLLLALAGCSGSGGGGQTAAAGGGTAGCLARSWKLDVADAATQLGSQLATNGLNVVSSEGAGSETLTFAADRTAKVNVDLTYTITVAESGGHTITIVQKHSGQPGGAWTLGDSDVVTFSGWDNNGYSIQNTIMVDGVASNTPITVPSDTFGNDTPMTVDCSAAALATHVDPSPFTNHWTPQG